MLLRREYGVSIFIAMWLWCQNDFKMQWKQDFWIPFFLTKLFLTGYLEDWLPFATGQGRGACVRRCLLQLRPTTLQKFFFLLSRNLGKLRCQFQFFLSLACAVLSLSVHLYFKVMQRGMFGQPGSCHSPGSLLATIVLEHFRVMGQDGLTWSWQRSTGCYRNVWEL